MGLFCNILENCNLYCIEGKRKCKFYLSHCMDISGEVKIETERACGTHVSMHQQQFLI